MHLRMGKERCMRRKLFLMAAVLTGAVFIILSFFPDLAVPRTVSGDSGMTDHKGTVLSVRFKSDHFIMIIDDERGFKIRLNYYGEQDAYNALGCSISYLAELAPGDNARNPHCFDYRKYLRSEGVYLTGTLKDWEVIDTTPGIRLKYRVFLQRIRLGFENILPEKSRGMIMGMLFGDTGAIPDEVYDDFRRNGTAHILAVSGLHIGILYSIYEKLTGGRRGSAKFILLIFIMFTYGELSLWRPSVIRAELMILMKETARIKELRYDSLTAMSAAAVLMIALNPYVIYGTGFQMSFLAIISINILSKNLPEKIPKSLSQTISVNLAMIFYQAYVFNYISPLAVLINVPVLYLAEIAIPLAFTGLVIYTAADLLGGIREGIEQVIIMPASSVSELMVKINSLLSMKGMSAVDVISPPQPLVIMALMGMFFICSEYAGILKLRNKTTSIRRILICLILASLMAGILTYEPMSRDEIVFVDVGQGACTHIRCGSADCLIDGGGSRTRDLGKTTLKPYLLKNGARDCDLALATHEDMDHIKGLEELEQDMKVRSFIKGSLKGVTYRMSKDVYIETLWPPEIRDKDKQENEESSVFMIHYGSVRILVVGDLDKDGEHAMADYYSGLGQEGKLRADVLNIGHHGSKTSTSGEFLDRVKPRLAVIQVGRNNYGHPSEEVLKRLEERGITVLRNDLSGAVGLDIRRRGGTWEIASVHTMLKAEA